MVECRQAVGAERPERWELLAQPLSSHLIQILGRRNVLQSVSSQRSIGRAGDRAVAREVACRARYHDLFTMRGRTDPCGHDDVHPYVPLVSELWLARVDPDPQPECFVRRPRLLGQRALDLHRRLHRVSRASECEEDAVTGPVDLVPVARGRRGADDLAHTRACRREPFPERVQHARRSLEVREQQRDRAARQPMSGGDERSHLCESRSGSGTRLRDDPLDSEPYTVRPVFDTLSDRLQSALGDLRGRGRLDDESISKAMREIRLALLEADVNLQVAKDFTNSVKERATGQDVLRSLTPGQQVVKIVHEELTALMGSSDSRLVFGRPPTVILLAGLQGSGKTTAAAKLALLLRRDGKHPGLVACDLQRPAAVDQLVQLGRQIQVPVFATERADPVKAAKLGLEQARSEGLDVVILDTAGRLHVDDDLMAELERVAAETKPANVLLVLDAMTGQEAVNVAVAFQERVSFDGVILTKLDGDARGGAALSVRAVTGRPVKFASVGEKLDQLEYFHPDRMASRILGMGDVLTLIEKAEAAVEEDDQAEMEKRLRAGEFTFDDFLASYRMLRKMGPLQGVLKLVPGLGKQLQGMDVDEAQLARVEAIVLSMTPQERRLPHIISMQRRRRIATGSGTSLDEVNKLMAARKQMAKMMKQMGKGKMPTLPPGALPGSR